MRTLFLTLCAFALATTAQAQTPCTGGSAGGYPCNGVDLLAHLSSSTFGDSHDNDIWGWTDPETGHEYALVGNDDATGFVDVTNPTSPVYIGKLPTATSSSTWRDIKTYGNYAFIVSEASSHGMQVFDLTRLRDVVSPPVTFTADARYTGFGHAHNLVIDTESGFAYGVGTSNCSGGLAIVDIRDPLNPTTAGCFGGDGYTHDAQCVVYDGPDADYTGHEICVGYNEDEVAFVDVTNKSNPVLISRGFYPNAGYTHQGWFTEDKRHIVLDDELDEEYGLTSKTRLVVMDVEDLDSPEYDFAYLGPFDNIDHNLYVRGQYVYWSNYTAGLRILDISGIDDDVITEVASFDTYPSSNGTSFSGQWSNYPFFASGNIVANDQNNGLFVLKATGLAAALAADIEPVSPPIVIPASGGPFSFTASLTNPGSQSQTVDAWVAAVLPNGNDYGRPVVGPRVVTLNAGQTLGPLTFTQQVPAAAPPGTYTIELRVGDYPGVVDASDSFTLTKQAASEAPAAEAAATTAAAAFSASPNPFTDRTAVRFSLDEAASVRLAVYDARGREVAVLVNETLPAGPHEAAFDAAGLPSGTYFVLLEAGDRVERQALTLLR